jgi:hypothetical protein
MSSIVDRVANGLAKLKGI